MLSVEMLSSSAALKITGRAFFKHTVSMCSLWPEALSSRAMNRMKSVGSKGLAGLYLSAAYLKAGETSIARSLFEGAINDKAVRYGEESDGNFHSEVRDQALVLELFALFDDKRAEGVAKALQDVLKSSRSLNTQESSQILRTLAGYLQSKGGSGVKAVVVSNQGRVELSSDKLSAQRSFSKLTELAIENKDTAPVYATLRLGGYLKPSKSKKMNRGLAVNVTYRSFDNGTVLDPTRLMQGTDFAIDVKVTNQSGKLIKNIALTHLVPSGWEILDRPLKAKVAGVDLKDIRDDRVLTYFAIGPRKDQIFQSSGACCISRAFITYPRFEQKRCTMRRHSGSLRRTLLRFSSPVMPSKSKSKQCDLEHSSLHPTGARGCGLAVSA